MPTTSEETVPYTLTLPDGNLLFLRLPTRMTGRDRDGSLTFNAEGLQVLDKIQVLAMKTPPKPSPGYLKTVRAALGVTQADFAQRLGYSTISVKKWETGNARPGAAAVKKIQKLVERCGRAGLRVT